MEFKKNADKARNKRAFWSSTDSRVYNFIKDRLVVYKREVELNFEDSCGPPDIGRSLHFLTELAPKPWVRKMTETWGNSTHDFYYSVKNKTDLIQIELTRKKKILMEYEQNATKFGVWLNKDFLPKVLNRLGFVVEGINCTDYNLVTLKGDIDMILTPFRPCESKIFVEIKNALPFFDKQELSKFFKKLKQFNGLKIIPVVIARKIYEIPKEILMQNQGTYFELGKVLIPEEFKEISKNYNSNIANVTSVIPDRLIPEYILEKFTNLRKFNEGLDFSSKTFDFM